MYIYIYIYIDVCVWLSVYGWVTKEGNYLQHLCPASECLERSLGLFWHEDHTKNCARVNLRDWKNGRRILVESGVRLQSSE